MEEFAFCLIFDDIVSFAKRRPASTRNDSSSDCPISLSGFRFYFVDVAADFISISLFEKSSHFEARIFFSVIQELLR